MPHLLLYTILKQKQQRKQQHLTHTTRLKEENRNTRRVNDVEIFDPLKSKWPNKHAHNWNKLSTLATTKSRSMLIFPIDALNSILSMMPCFVLLFFFFVQHLSLACKRSSNHLSITMMYFIGAELHAYSTLQSRRKNKRHTATAMNDIGFDFLQGKSLNQTSDHSHTHRTSCDQFVFLFVRSFVVINYH